MYARDFSPPYPHIVQPGRVVLASCTMPPSCAHRVLPQCMVK